MFEHCPSVPLSLRRNSRVPWFMATRGGLGSKGREPARWRIGVPGGGMRGASIASPSSQIDREARGRLATTRDSASPIWVFASRFLLRQFGFLLRVFASGVSASPWRAASRSSWPCDAAPSRDAVQERRRRAVLRLRSNREHAVVLPGFLLFQFGFLLWNSCFTMVSVLEILEAGRCRQEHRRRAVLRLGSNREQ